MDDFVIFGTDYISRKKPKCAKSVKYNPPQNQSTQGRLILENYLREKLFLVALHPSSVLRYKRKSVT